VQPELIRNFSSRHGIGQILLVGKHEKHRIAEFVFVEHALQFVSGFSNTISVIGINHENDALRVLEVLRALALTM